MRKRFLPAMLALALAQGASGFTIIPPSSVQEKRPNSLELVVTGGQEKGLRAYLRNEISAQFPSVKVFGCYLDQVEEHIAPLVEHLPEDSSFAFTLDVPDYFFREEIGVWVKVKRKGGTLELYSAPPEDSLLLRTHVAVGGRHEDAKLGKERDFFTAKGTYYFNRIVKDPWWYPREWSEYTEPFPPGAGNPLGGWMMELIRSPVAGSYDFEAAPNQTGMRIHTAWYSSRFHHAISTHGCIRLQKDYAEEFFQALLQYLPHREPVTTSRGTIYPLLAPVKVVISDE